MTEDIQAQIMSRREAKARSLKFYFTGKPCSQGHIDRRRTCNGHCVACIFASWDKDRLREYGRDRYAKNIDVLREKNRAHRVRNREAEIKRRKEWGASNPDRIREANRAWQAAHPEIVTARQAALRARRRKAPGRFTAVEIQNLLIKQQQKCAYCSISIEGGFHRDHVVPLAKGGTNWISNIVLTCAPCNHRKAATDLDVFLSKVRNVS